MATARSPSSALLAVGASCSKDCKKVPSSLSMRSSQILGRPASLALRQTAVTASQTHSASKQQLAARGAKREEELKEIRTMSPSDIEQAVFDLKGELFLLRSKQALRLDYKASEFGRIRRRIARMLTVRREREIEQGINKRASRKLDRVWRKSVVPRPPPSFKPEEWGK